MGEDIVITNNISLAPKSEKTILAPNQKSQTINSMNDKVSYGFAVDYTVSGNDKIVSIFKTQAFSVSELLE